MNILESLMNLLAPKTKKYFDQSVQTSSQDLPSAKYQAGMPDASVLKFLENRVKEDFNKDAFKSAAEIGSYMVPFGKGANLATKVLAPGATVGALNAVSQDNVTPTSTALNVLGGMGGAWGLDKLGNAGSKVISNVSSKLPENIMNKLLRPTQVKSTKAETESVMKGGESIGKWALGQNLKGSAEGMYRKVLQNIDSLETQIQNKVQNSKEIITSNELLAKISPYYEKLVRAGNQGDADRLLGRVTDIVTANGDNIPVSLGNQIKRTLYKESKSAYDQTSTAYKEGLKLLGNAFKEGVEKVPGVENINKDYSRYMQAEDALLNQLSRGTRNLNLGLMDVGIGAMGSVIGGLPGAMAAVGGRKLAQSPTTQSALANLLFKGNQQLPAIAAKTAPVTNYVGGQVGARGGGALMNLLFGNKGTNEPNQPTNQNPDENTQMPSYPGVNFSNPTPQDTNLPEFSQMGAVEGDTGSIKDGQLSPEGQWIYSEAQGDWVPNKGGGAGGMSGMFGGGDQMKSQMAMAAMTLPSGEFDKLKTAYKIITGEDLIPDTKAQKYPSSMVTRMADFDASEKSLLGLAKSIKGESGKMMGPIQGRLRKKNPYDVSAQSFESQMRAVAQDVGKAMEGGVLRAEDVPKYRAILPNIDDTSEVAMNKIINVMQQLAIKKQAQVGAFSTYQGFDTVEQPTISQ